MSEADLTNLERIFNQLEKINSDLQMKLNNSELTIAELLAERENYLKERQNILNELEDYKTRLELTESQSIQIQNLLAKADQSLKALERKIRWLRFERFLWFAGGIILGKWI